MYKQWIRILCVIVMLMIGFAGSVQAYLAEVTYTLDGIDLDLGTVEHDPTLLWLLMGDPINEILRPPGILYPDAPPDFSPAVDLSFEFDPLAGIEVVLHDSVKIAMVEDGTSFDLVGADTLDSLTFLDALPGSLAVDDADILFASVLVALTSDNRYFKLGHFEHLTDLQLILSVEEVVIPEPSTLLLLGLGILGLLVRLRRRPRLFAVLFVVALLAGAQPLYAQDNITISKAGCGKGTVWAGGVKGSCGPECSEMTVPYDANTAVLLKATPEPDSTFVGWEDREGNSLAQSFRPQAGDIVRAVFDCAYETVSLSELDLNRIAVPLASEVLQNMGFHDAHTGFMWQSGDTTTTSWRPRGIAGVGTFGNRNFLAVSWNGQNNYVDRGVRISFVDLDSMTYQHVLLVDEDCHTFAGMTGGGLVYRLGKLHVPDTRGRAKVVHVFSVDSIRKVAPDDFYGYAYILKAESLYEVPITPSFMSYDWDRDQVLTGTSSSTTPKDLAWYTIGAVDGDSPSCGPFFPRMQGAASDADVLWVAESSNNDDPSYLHITYFDAASCSGDVQFNDRVLEYPPGLQDMHISTSDNLWMLTAFGPAEGIGNIRIVFATKKDNLLPYATVLLSDLDLNRTARKLSSGELPPLAHTGFQWIGSPDDPSDNTTLKWRPQGIAGVGAFGTRNFLAVSWYGLEEEDYEDRGVRVSFVDVHDMNSIHYRHVLLVDEYYNTFVNMHAGGLVYRDGKLHVPDSRESRKKEINGVEWWPIHVFSVDSIQAVPDSDRDEFYNYAYILKRESFYYVPIKPSFMSYDWDRGQVLVGTYEDTDDGDPKNRLAWYEIGNVESTFVSCGSFWGKMQGAASDGNILWAASSFGRTSKSTLHIATVNIDSCSYDNHREIDDYPPGLEDLHITSASDNPNIWMLTEFGENERWSVVWPFYYENNRIVFATKKSNLMP